MGGHPIREWGGLFANTVYSWLGRNIYISLEAGLEINLQITPPVRSSPVEDWFDLEAYEHEKEPSCSAQWEH